MRRINNNITFIIASIRINSKSIIFTIKMRTFNIKTYISRINSNLKSNISITINKFIISKYISKILFKFTKSYFTNYIIITKISNFILNRINYILASPLRRLLFNETCLQKAYREVPSLFGILITGIPLVVRFSIIVGLLSPLRYT